MGYLRASVRIRLLCIVMIFHDDGGRKTAVSSKDNRIGQENLTLIFSFNYV